MIEKLMMTVLVDNREGKNGLETEHGFSVWIEAGDRRILFDAGQTSCSLRNAARLGIDVTTADALVVSHGHFDHTGCISQLLEVNDHCAIYAHPGIATPRYSLQADGAMKPIGISNATRRAISAHEKSVISVEKPVLLYGGIGCTGAIPRLTAYEDTGGQFFLDMQASVADPVTDDMAMWFATREGTVVLTGCGHSGIVNTIGYVRSLTGNAPVRSVIGGFHLLHATEQRLEETCRYCSETVSEKIIPCHCTGDDAVNYMKARLPGKVDHGYTGMVIMS